MSEQLPLIEVSSQPIELCKLLKIANMVSGGGEAKIVISEGYVLLNGEMETQKRKKVYDKDIVEFNGEVIEVAYCPTSAAEQQTKQDNSHTKPSKNKKTKKLKQADVTLIETPNSKRKPISF